MLFRVLVLKDGKWHKVAEYDQLDDAFEMRDEYRLNYRAEVVVRLEKGYFRVENDGSTHPLCSEHPPEAA